MGLKSLFSRKKKKGESSPKAAASVTTTATVTPVNPAEPEEPAEIVIVGAGIVGLVLALALDKHCGIKVELYEKAKAFHDDVGAGMGMYPNGLRVIRDISPELLQQIRQSGHPYLFRRWAVRKNTHEFNYLQQSYISSLWLSLSLSPLIKRHDGTEIAVADEKVLAEGEEDLQTVGIRRWKLQKVLFQAVQDAGITVHFDKRLKGIKKVDDLMTLKFEDGSTRLTKLLLGADGSRSQVRKLIDKKKCEMKYSGVTCLMGTSTVPRETKGICLPSSQTTKCHGAFYPTGETEQCFQFHFPMCLEEAQPALGSWGTLTEMVGQEECDKLATRLKEEGWDEKFITPLHHVDKALKVAFCTLEPHLDSFVYNGRIALVGDAAHPPVPYLGQGAQQGLEDAGTLALLLKHLCMERDESNMDKENVDGGEEKYKFSMTHVATALKLYNQLRVPRTEEILHHGKTWGNMQQKRADNPKYNKVKEINIQRDVFFHETMPVLFHGAKHDYKLQVAQVLEEETLLPVPEEAAC